MVKKTEKPVLVEFKEHSIQLRNEWEAEKDPHKKLVLRFNLKSARFWERLLEGLIFVLIIVILSGCIENTMRGCGRMIQGAGELVTGVGKDVVRGTDGYSNER